MAPLNLLYLRAQDPVSSHTFLNHSFYNPAWSGLSESVEATINYRNQWPGLKNAFNTYQSGIHGITFNNNMGIGCIVSRDVTGGGTFSNSGIDLLYTYFININTFSKLGFGLQASLYQNIVNESEMTEIPSWSVHYTADPGITYSGFYPDFTFGAIYKSLDYSVGISLFHILQPNKYANDVASAIQRRYNFSVQYQFPINSRFRKERQYIVPSINIDLQDEVGTITYGAHLLSGVFEPGVCIRHEFLSLKSTSFILSSKINFLNLYIVYSFDMLLTNSYLTFVNFGIHEVTLGYIIKYKGKRKKTGGTINCPYD